MFKMFFKKKKNFNNFFYNFIGFLQFFGLILLCSGTKSCPESTRPHLTQCDKYFRCNQLPNKTYVWIPSQCDKGLVYEPSLKICVLPGENWECNLTEELANYQISNDENNVYGINNIQLGDYINEDITLNDLNANSSEDYESSENNNSSELYIDMSTPVNGFNSSAEDVNEYESSGDGIFISETKEYVINNTNVSIPESIDFDNRLTSHLQRLTQLIDSIKNQNHSKDTKGELMADQLNHFLDNYNLMTQQNYDENDTSKITVSEDGHMHQDHIDEIISQQNKLTIDDVVKQTINTGLNGVSVLYPLQEPNVDIKFHSDPDHLKKGYRKPEIKVPQSQIIINRPGGSVLFSIDSYNNLKESHSGKPHRDEPIISEETLKTVLELSNQLIQNQNNNRQVYPIYYTVPIPVITKKKHKHSSHKRYYKKPPISVQNSFNTINEGPTKGLPSTINSGNHDGGNNISTTVIFQRHDDPTPVWITESHKHKPHHKHHDEPDSNHDTVIYQDPNTNSPTFSTYYDPSSTEYDHNPNHQHQDVPLSSHEPLVYENPNSNSPSFSTYYDPSYNPYQPPNNPPHYQSNNPYENPNSYYDDSQYLNSPFLPTPYYPPDVTTTTTTPAPTTTTTTTTTTERYTSQDADEDMFTYPGSGTTGTGNFGMSPFNSYNPLVSNLGLLQLNDDNQDKLINFGGSYISYNSYKNTLLPLLQPSTLGGGLEILTCTTGVRQPNMTDCSRYYVCNPRTQNVLSYACPPFTAFNKGTKICDGKSYAVCKPEAIMNRYTVAENMRLQQEAQKALAEAQKIRNDVFKQSALASLLQSQNMDSLGSFDNKPINIIQTDSAPIVPNQTTTKRRIRCYDTGKISDPDSPRNYWVCFRGPNGRMKRQKMTCANGLLFCKNTRYCTLPKKC